MILKIKKHTNLLLRCGLVDKQGTKMNSYEINLYIN
jgi:hypothetical protein